MKVSYQWLKSIGPELEAGIAELSERLAALGFPVEEVATLSEGFEGLVVAEVQGVREHPDADRLRLCDVDGGQGVVQVVCGADNVVEGGWYPFAPVGSTLPGGVTIGKVQLRGQESQGMLCSEKELGLGPDGTGLMVLEGRFSAGQPLASALGLEDLRLDVEVTANRPDLLSHEGIAREVAPGGHTALTLPPIPGEDPAASEALERLERHADPEEVSGDGVTIRIEAPDLCPRYVGLVVRGVRVAPSPHWLQTRLRAVGARPINNVVDATNYVLLELGQPLHAFDLQQVGGRSVVVRRARQGERIRTLDGEDRALNRDMLGICDEDRPMAVAGVIGGEESEVTDETSDVLLECALFTPGPIRSTRKALGLSTEASYRYERGVDPELQLRALRRVARIILATAGGEIRGPILDCRPGDFSRKTVSLRPSRVEALLGIPFDHESIRELLEPLGFSLEPQSPEELRVDVPGFRSYDVTREVDLIEEIARTHGYDHFPDVLGAFRPGAVPDHPLFELEDRVRDELVAWGMLEAQTPAFAPEGEGEVELLNPISSEERFLRGRLLPGLVRRLEYNLARGNRSVRLFEIGTVFALEDPGDLPRERTHLAAILHGDRFPPHWENEARGLDIWDLKGVLGRVADVVVGEGASVGPDAEGDSGSPFDPASRLVVRGVNGEAVGEAGRMPAARMDLPPWAGPVWGFELSLPVEPGPRKEIRYRPLPTHPGVDRDLALLLPEDLPVEELRGYIGREAGKYLRETRVFDVYRGKDLPEGHRSVALRLHFRAPGRTLTDLEVDEAVRRIVDVLREELGVGIRGQQDASGGA